MINLNVIECASTYLYSPARQVSKTSEDEKKHRKVEATASAHTGKQFNKNADTKSNFDQHIDICV